MAKPTTNDEPPFTTMLALVEAIAQRRAFRTPEHAPGVAPILLSIEREPSPVILVTGENASGKSFFARVLKAYVSRNYGWESIGISMAHRTGGYMASAFYGDEGTHSTGLISLGMVQKALHNLKDRDESKRNNLMSWDEPDIGLSESYQWGMGELIVNTIRNRPEHTRGVMVVTHSRPIAACLAAMEVPPIHVRVGDTKTLDQFLFDPIEQKTADDVRRLNKRARQLWIRLKALEDPDILKRCAKELESDEPDEDD